MRISAELNLGFNTHFSSVEIEKDGVKMSFTKDEWARVEKVLDGKEFALYYRRPCDYTPHKAIFHTTDNGEKFELETETEE